METKICSKCNAEKPLTDFHKRITKSGKNIGQPMCKACKKDISSLRYKDKKEEIKHKSINFGESPIQKPWQRLERIG